MNFRKHHNRSHCVASVSARLHHIKLFFHLIFKTKPPRCPRELASSTATRYLNPTVTCSASLVMQRACIR